MNILPNDILFEDKDILVLNKPAGLVVNRADTTSEETLQDWLAEQVIGDWSQTSREAWLPLVPSEFAAEYGTPEEIFAERLGLVHRLDKETSGALVLAKNPGALVNLLAQFKNRQVTKQYLALCHGKFGVEHDTLHLPLGRASHNRQQFAVRPDGRTAETEYQVQTFFPHLDIEKVMALPTAQGSDIRRKAKVYQGFSLVACWPHTGRTHQIRVHLAHIKHPLVGDAVYVGKKRQSLDAAWCPRHFLHAAELSFKHPRTDQTVHISAPLTPDLGAVLELLLRD